MTGAMQLSEREGERFSFALPYIILQANTLVFVFQRRNAVALLSFPHQQREVRANPCIMP